MKILAVKLRRLGDTVLWTAALQALKQIPNAHVDIAFPEEYEDLFLQDPRFENKFLVPRATSKRLALFYALRQNAYDVVLNFHASQSSGLLCTLVGANKKVIHSHSRTGTSLRSNVEIPNLGVAQPATERDLNVVRALGWSGPSPTPKLQWEATKRKSTKPLLLISPFASRLSKQWPLNRYHQLCETLLEKWEVGIICESRRNFSFPKDVQIFETPTLSAALTLISQAQCYVGSDSGLKHVACALGVSTVTLFGPESVGEWHCYPSPQHRVLQKAVPCRFHDPNPPEFSWCGETVCPLASHACMNLITVEEVTEQISQLNPS